MKNFNVVGMKSAAAATSCDQAGFDKFGSSLSKPRMQTAVLSHTNANHTEPHPLNASKESKGNALTMTMQSGAGSLQDATPENARHYYACIFCRHWQEHAVCMLCAVSGNDTMVVGTSVGIRLVTRDEKHKLATAEPREC